MIMIKKYSVLAVVVSVAVGIVGAIPVSSAGTLEEALGSGKAALDLRYRYETVDQAGTTEKAKASTLRTRISYITGDFYDFSASLEFDDVTAFGDIKYDDATGLATAQTSYPVVADPEGTEVNQANISYKGLANTTVKLGRQRVIFDNARFIGNVGWRQNEQTYDALAIVNKSLSDTTVVYGYVTNINRIFGEASSKGNIDTKTHLINIAYSGLTVGKVSAYGYFLDLIDAPTGSNSTLGARFSGAQGLNDEVKVLYSVEFATQSDYKEGAQVIDADYSLLEVGVEFQKVTVKVGVETLGGDGVYGFSTPLATAHAFNGWADKFLNTPVTGLEDTYVSVGGKLFGVKLLGVYHDYSADTGGASYGDEFNLLIAKKYAKRYTALIKYASYDADTFATDTDKLWLMGQAKF